MDVFDSMKAIADEHNAAEMQGNFQERIVKQLLRYAGVQIPLAVTKREAKDKYGTDDLNFFWFNQEYPSFPVYLLAQKLRYTHKATLSQLYGKGQFKKLPWWKEYETQTGTHAIDLRNERAVLFFNLPHAKEAFLMTLHNQPTQASSVIDAEQRQDEPWPRTIFPVGKSGITVVLEAFPSFMETVGTDWAESL